MDKIRVAFFAEILEREFDGATRTIFQIIDRIDPNKFEFLFFCGVAPEGNFHFKMIQVPSVTIPFNNSYKMASMFGMGPTISKELGGFAPDVIHVSTPSPLGFYAMKYGRAHGIPVLSIYHTHFLSYIKYYTQNTPIITRAIEQAIVLHNKSFYDRCEMIYVPTDEMISQLKDYGFNTEKMKIWKRGIDLCMFHPGKRNRQILKVLVGNDHPNILFVSRLVWEKNLELLIEMYNGCVDKGLEYNFIIAGDGVARKEMKKKMPGAFFMGSVPHDSLSKLYASADYFVFPSITETYGNVVAEAMASGIPCIVGDGGGVKSLIRQGVNGFLCNPDDARDFLKMIEILRNQPELTENIINQALSDVRDQDWDLLVSSYFRDLQMLSRLELPRKDRSSSINLLVA